MPAPTPWFVYLVRCGDDALYTGIALNVERRIADHREGRGAKYLRGRGPLTLAYQAQVADQGTALRIEYAIKRLPKAGKEALLHDPQQWRELLRAATRP